MEAPPAPGQNPWAVGVEPDVAASAESPDAQTWTVKLKQSVKFHDKVPVNGRELTSADVLSSWKRLSAATSPDAALAKSAGWGKIEAVDDYTLTFTLDFPSADFLDDLADTNEASRTLRPAPGARVLLLGVDVLEQEVAMRALRLRCL